MKKKTICGLVAGLMVAGCQSLPIKTTNKTMELPKNIYLRSNGPTIGIERDLNGDRIGDRIDIYLIKGQGPDILNLEKVGYAIDKNQNKMYDPDEYVWLKPQGSPI
ncbi:hypothetical protein [Oceanihabitans sediminis]|uniref:hypothetical protein n=1 Tax=Oceanihabitans sediminis TaxID=1812012 RepID=UPI00299E10D9|nr:hypothetical protein [Oceanihabitans sediminis]MDX1279440.1 hypothetical protein [Oceanihabitans sediminis]